jgi:hypothetical protein
MVTEAKWAYGTALMKGAVAIAELTNINGLDLDSDEIDVTNHDSPDGFEEVIRTIKRTGVVALEGNFVPGNAGQAALMADYLTIDGTPAAYTIDFSPTGLAAEWNFTAFVKKAPSTEAPVDGKIPFSAELRVTGAPSLDLDYSGNITTIAISDGTLAPAYSATIYDYVASVLTGVSEVDFTVTEAGAGVLTVNGQVVSSGNAATFALGAAGSVTEFIVARKETGKIPRRYTVNIARASA